MNVETDHNENRYQRDLEMFDLVAALLIIDVLLATANLFFYRGKALSHFRRDTKLKTNLSISGSITTFFSLIF